MSKNDELAADEAYAFLNVVAPKLEQLRRRLLIANDHLKSRDPEQARLNAIVESQTAIREFLAGIPHLSNLVEPIDVLLDAVTEEPAATAQAPDVPEPVEEPPEPEPVLEPEPEPEPEPVAEPPAASPPPQPTVAEPPAASPPPQPTVAAPPASAPKQDQPIDAWLRIGTALMVERLTNAGMPAASAESHVADVYATVGLSQASGSPISPATIREWRGGFVSTRQASWRGTALKRKVSGRPGVNPVVDAQQRVADMAVTFKKMAQLGATQSKGR